MGKVMISKPNDFSVCESMKEQPAIIRWERCLREKPLLLIICHVRPYNAQMLWVHKNEVLHCLAAVLLSCAHNLIQLWNYFSLLPLKKMQHNTDMLSDEFAECRWPPRHINVFVEPTELIQSYCKCILVCLQPNSVDDLPGSSLNGLHPRCFIEALWISLKILSGTNESMPRTLTCWTMRCNISVRIQSQVSDLRPHNNAEGMQHRWLRRSLLRVGRSAARIDGARIASADDYSWRNLRISWKASGLGLGSGLGMSGWVERKGPWLAWS